MSTNRNYTHGQSFITFNDKPNSAYYIQKYNLPGFTLGETTQSTPYQTISVPGSQINFNAFNATFILDEEMKTWFEIWKWMKENNTENNTADFALYIFNNTAKRFVMKIDFIGAWVNQQNDVMWADFATNDDTQPKLLDVLFKYAYYVPTLLDESASKDIIEGVL